MVIDLYLAAVELLFSLAQTYGRPMQ